MLVIVRKYVTNLLFQVVSLLYFIRFDRPIREESIDRQREGNDKVQIEQSK